MAIKTQTVVADFETTVTPNDLRVWAACAVDIETLETVHLGNSIHGFFEWLKDKNTKCYMHNLKFDGEWLLSYLLLHGYKYSKTPTEKTFDALITDTGLFYQITVIFEKKNKKYKKVVFYDSLKKLPFKVSVISKAFELPDEKLEIDYKAPRPIGHELTEQEKHYIVNDCKIVAEALKIQFSKGLKRMTNASDAFNTFKEGIGKQVFSRYFPVFTLELDAIIRKSYKGGFTYLQKRFAGVRGLKGITLDINSLYPWVLYEKKLPYGYPIRFEGVPDPDEKFDLFIVHMKCAFDLKPNHLPTIQIKKSFRFIPTEYLESSDGEIVDLWLTSVDLELFKEHYFVTDEVYIDGYKFKSITGVFKEYIDYWMNIKETSTGALRQLAKLQLNSLYGRFATNPRRVQKIPYIDEDEIVRYKFSDPEFDEPIYTALASFVTAYAREKTIRSAQAVYDRFIYADTDSLHLIGTEIPEGIEVHPTKLGAWKLEGSFVDSKYIRAKTYMETMQEVKPRKLETYAKLLQKEKIETIVHRDGQIVYTFTEVKCAGMPDNVKESVTYDNFHSGSIFEGKLVPHRYRGGVVLEETTFSIK